MAEAHWTEELFVKHADLFLKVHEAGLQYAEAQAEQLDAILKAQGLRNPGKLLDVPCGIGRHALAFASRGWEVVGADMAPLFVERAQRLAKAMGLAGNATFVAGDFRRVGEILAAHRGSFNVILNLFTSIGYWDDATDLALLQQLRGLAAPRGLLLLDTINRDHLVKHFEAQGKEAYGDLVYLEERAFNFDTSRVEAQWTFYTKEGQDLHHQATIKLSTRAYSPHELRHLLEAAGWSKVEVHGGWALGSASPDSYHMMALGRA